MMDLLSELGEKHGTDKVSTHRYTERYHQRFQSLQGEPVHLLEIGVGGYKDPHAGGESLRMWRDYFTNPDAVIVGLDVFEKDLDIEGVQIVQGDAANPKDLNELADAYGPFDIVIDDGSHKPDDVLQSWVVLWDHVTSPGWYCIEDLMTSYWPPFGGSSVRTGETVIGFLQGLIDRIHYADFDIPGYTPNRFDLSVVELQVTRNLAFLRKGDNSTPSLWMPEHPHGQVFLPDGTVTSEAWNRQFPRLSDV